MTFQDTYRNVDPYEGEIDNGPEHIKRRFAGDVKDAHEHLTKLFAPYEDDLGDLGGNFDLSGLLDRFKEIADDTLYMALREIEQGGE